MRTYWIQQIFITLNSLSGAMVFLQADVAFEMRILFVLIGIAIVVLLVYVQIPSNGQNLRANTKNESTP